MKFAGLATGGNRIRTISPAPRSQQKLTLSSLPGSAGERRVTTQRSARSSRDFHRRWRSDAIQGLERHIDEIRPRPGDATENYQAFLVGNRADRINHRSGGRL